MRFVQHPSNNRVLGAPGGWDQQQLECGALPITDSTVKGEPVLLSFWKPDAEELARLNAGEHVALYIFGQGMPPVAIGVTK